MDIKNFDIVTLLKKNLKYMPYGVVFYLVNLLSKFFRHVSGGSDFERIIYTITNFKKALSKPLPSLHPQDIVLGLAFSGALFLFLYFKSKKSKKFRKGVEHGSARWGSKEDILPFIDTKQFTNNILLTNTERITMGKPSTPQNARNKNVLVVGGSGSGKTRFFVKPNLMQQYGSYVALTQKAQLSLNAGKC